MQEVTVKEKSPKRFGRYLQLGGILLALAVALGLWRPSPNVEAQNGTRIPQYRVDPSWPKPFPIVKDEKGVARQWVSGDVGGSCIARNDNIITVNRAYQRNGITAYEARTAMPIPPVVEFDPQGNVVSAWTDKAKLTSEGAGAILPNGLHGCFVDYQDNIWIGGSGDGIVQKWSRDGKKLLLQIGEKGLCDGEPTGKGVYPTCGAPQSLNSSRTRLNNPAHIAVDPNPDPATGQPGSVYIADGYGNHRVVVFDSQGKYLRQWGSPGSGPGQFVAEGGGGHPHCVVIGNDGLVYACDRGNNRIQVFDKLGNLKRIIPVDPPEYAGQSLSQYAANFIAFSPDKEQSLIYDTDLDAGRVWVLDRASGKVVGSVGAPGHYPGQFSFPHSVNFDSKGNLYVAEVNPGKRIQKFVRTN